MKTKRVNRYYCDFCKKSGGSSFYMKKHERGCTLRPDRVCWMCQLGDLEQPEMPAMLSLLPSRDDYMVLNSYGHSTFDYKRFEAAMKDAYPRLVAACSDDEIPDGCPACIMAALRQSGCLGSARSYDLFDYQEVRKKFWNIVNESQWDHERYLRVTLCERKK